MALSIKNDEVERLAREIASLTGESKTEAVRRALSERRERLRLAVSEGARISGFLRYLEEEIWPLVPEGELGRRLKKAEEEEILDVGPDGA